MNIKNILNFISHKYKDSNIVSKEILKEIEDTILEIEVAESMFNHVDDEKLIDAAIYREEYARKKFDYLICMAKKQYKIYENEERKINAIGADAEV